MKVAIFTLLALAGLSFVPEPAEAQPFVHRPHYLQERQQIPRKPTYEDYYLRKYGRLPPYARGYVVPVAPVLPPGSYVPGYGVVPQGVILD